MKVLILGGDGYLGWPTAMYLCDKGWEVQVVDNFSKRCIEMEEGVSPLSEVPSLRNRISSWKKLTGKDIRLHVGDILNDRFIYSVLESFQPDSIVHYAEQPSAPYSMRGRSTAIYTQYNNVLGTLNLLFAIQSKCPDAHLIKLGSMGEYGTPNIDIEEGYLSVKHNDREDQILFPKRPHSFYHLSKVHDSNNIFFACNNWGIRATDLNQGVVYGVHTDQTLYDPSLCTSFHYDDVFGTVVNRFCVEAVSGRPLTIYGRGTQKRSFLNIRDTLRCVELALINPAEKYEFRVFNQFTETFSINELAEKVQVAGKTLGYDVTQLSIPNPRQEKEDHYYNPKNDNLLNLGLIPRRLSDSLVEEMITHIEANKDRIDKSVFEPRVNWSSNTIDKDVP